MFSTMCVQRHNNSDTYISQGASGSPLVVGAGGSDGLLPTLGACVHHPLLPQAALQSFTFGQQLKVITQNTNQSIVLAPFNKIQNHCVSELTAE